MYDLKWVIFFPFENVTLEDHDVRTVVWVLLSCIMQSLAVESLASMISRAGQRPNIRHTSEVRNAVIGVDGRPLPDERDEIGPDG